MVKPKKIQIGNNQDYLSPDFFVEKSKALLSYMNSSMTIGEYRLLDTYISRINARDDDKTEVVFTKKEYEKLLANNNSKFQLKTDELNKHLTRLSKQQVDLDKYDDGKTTHIVNLFSTARTVFTENGELTVILKCNDDVKPLFFNIAERGYIKYQLSNVLKLNSMNSINVYNYLLANAYRKKWEVSVKDFLKYAMFLENNDYYSNYKILNSKILKSAIANINAKTNLTVEYKAGTKSGSKGNKVTGIIFRIIRKDNMVFTDSLQDGVQTTLADTDVLSDINVACGNCLKDGQAQCLYDAAAAIDRDYLKQITGCEDRTQAIVKVIQNKYHLAEMYGADNPYSYVTTLLKEEQGREKTTHSQPNKTELQTKASYDIDELEKRDTFSDLNSFL